MEILDLILPEAHIRIVLEDLANQIEKDRDRFNNLSSKKSLSPAQIKEFESRMQIYETSYIVFKRIFERGLMFDHEKATWNKREETLARKLSEAKIELIIAKHALQISIGLLTDKSIHDRLSAAIERELSCQP